MEQSATPVESLDALLQPSPGSDHSRGGDQSGGALGGATQAAGGGGGGGARLQFWSLAFHLYMLHEARPLRPVLEQYALPGAALLAAAFEKRCAAAAREEYEKLEGLREQVGAASGIE